MLIIMIIMINMLMLAPMPLFYASKSPIGTPSTAALWPNLISVGDGRGCHSPTNKEDSAFGVISFNIIQRFV
jgi:hypothetical protein